MCVFLPCRKRFNAFSFSKRPHRYANSDQKKNRQTRSFQQNHILLLILDTRNSTVPVVIPANGTVHCAGEPSLATIVQERYMIRSHILTQLFTRPLLLWPSFYIQSDTKKRKLLKNPTKIEEIQEKKNIDRNWTITTCLLRDSNPYYQCLRITSCRWRPPPRIHTFTATTHFKSSRSFVSPCVCCMRCRMRQSQVLWSKAFHVFCAVGPQCIRRFSSCDFLQSSITTGYRANTVGIDAKCTSSSLSCFHT